MNTKRSSSAASGLTARLGSQILTYAYTMTLELDRSEVSHHLDTCYFSSLVEAATQYVNHQSRDVSWLRLLSYSQGLIMRSMFGQTPDRLSLRIVAVIGLCEQSSISNQKPARRCMLALPNRIVFAGSTVTIRHIHELTYCALNSFSDGRWHEPPQHSIVRRRATASFSLKSEIVLGGLIRTGKPLDKPMSALECRQLIDELKTQ